MIDCLFFGHILVGLRILAVRINYDLNIFIEFSFSKKLKTIAKTTKLKGSIVCILVLIILDMSKRSLSKLELPILW